MANKLEKFHRFLPKLYKTRTNSMWRGLVEALAEQDQEITTQLGNTKAQLFVKTAEGAFLDRLGNSLGVSRPAELGLLDEDYQALIPNLSLKAKQITKAFYDTMDVFWGPTFSRANILGSNAAPFNVSVGDSFEITIDGVTTAKVTAQIGDIAVNGSATSQEIIDIIARIDGITVEIQEDPNTGDENLNIRTNTPGPRGSIEISTTNSFGGVGWETGVRHRVTDLAQRTVLYQVDPGTMVIELPAVVPSLRRTLKGSHHFHQDSTIEPAVPPSNEVWKGSFLFSTTQQPFVVTQQKAVLEDVVLEGSVVSQITVDSTSDIPAEGGELIFNFGKENQEQPVAYITTPNNKTILIDPGHTFQFEHAIGSEINFLLPNQTTPFSPARDGTDFAIYLTSPANSRTVVQELLETLTAAGITITFIILLPSYKYLCENPYEE